MSRSLLPRWLPLLCCALAPGAMVGAEPRPILQDGERVLFLGDSITHAGDYVADIQAHLWQVHPDWKSLTLVNLGLPSETASGLSEPDHPFPRPCIHERLDRALEKYRPTVVFACYGMNDGIYYPPSPERLAAYQDGIQRLIAKVRRHGARVVLLTPTMFDPRPLDANGKLREAGADKYAWFAPYRQYDDVLREYSDWLLKTDFPEVDLVVDVRTPIVRETAAARDAGGKDFTFAADGIHLNADGHRLISQAILAALGEPPAKIRPELAALARRRTALLHNAWLTHVGHQRPGMKPGPPLQEAEAEAHKLTPKNSLAP